jgi:riboflavin transporter FmnP
VNRKERKVKQISLRPLRFLAIFAILIKNKMKKNTIIYGFIAGVIVSILMLSSVNYISHCEGNVDYGTSMLIGYASMIIAFSLVFVGIRNYRDKYNGGAISFGKAFKTGTLIVLIASTIYVIAWLIDYYFFIPDFMDKYAAHTLEDLKASGASQAKIDKETKDLASMVTMMKNPFFNAMMAYVEILPVGLIVTLISSLILKRKAQHANI